MERTFIFIKPDGVKKNLVGRILARFEERNIKIEYLTTASPSIEYFKKHYADHMDKDFFEVLINFSQSGPIVLAILKGENVIKNTREIVGETDPKNAQFGTIRSDYGAKIPSNIIHASDSPESANREINLWGPFLMGHSLGE